MTPIAIATSTPGQPINVTRRPGPRIAISPDGKAAYVTNQPSGTVTPIAIATNTPGKPIKIGEAFDNGFEAIVTVP